MISLITEIDVAGLTAKEVCDFMMHCTDEQYRRWWPGTHLTFHTIDRKPGELGNLVIFDEMVGKRRLKFRAVITRYTPNREIVWQMKRGGRLPAWLALRLEDSTDGVRIIHTLRAGFDGVLGKLTDPLLRLYLNKQFIHDLSEHANTEFNRLAVLLYSDRGRGTPGHTPNA